MTRTGRPKVKKPLINNVKIRFDDTLYKRLNKYCDKKGVTKTDIIRQAVADYLDKVQ